MKTLYEVVTYSLEYSARKHNLGDDYVTNEVDSWSNTELLTSISEALEEMHREEGL